MVYYNNKMQKEKVLILAEYKTKDLEVATSTFLSQLKGENKLAVEIVYCHKYGTRNVDLTTHSSKESFLGLRKIDAKNTPLIRKLVLKKIIQVKPDVVAIYNRSNNKCATSSLGFAVERLLNPVGEPPILSNFRWTGNRKKWKHPHKFYLLNKQ